MYLDAAHVSMIHHHQRQAEPRPEERLARQHADVPVRPGHCHVHRRSFSVRVLDFSIQTALAKDLLILVFYTV